ncbi:hypothetical protein G6F57_008786 [Rhizopus arrhizus]|uniref:MIT domain-containing protein n=1 Tax=Rhizopus oryzae TaxID=64495 RepID=A0A9P6X5H1_RHIOR|nr:hypothetical protein G6F23_005770 [Rhizopus arrhizus]KAG1416754.1 hypothetical protein G6F58_005822 [Rhizopus delemar]KAG0762796.1 hypothetical protein G6F24_006521 [Rhizopus arrhizus]KAG0788805.1 hypothetical protein G6F21_006955 [Rhizopus arrhizus]KAG0799157.1 hypothetical protein G6F22_003508 [Rhizopus arrhizus]
MSVDSSILPTTHSFCQQETKQASKVILRSALQKANAAVQCDSTNDVPGAIHAYKEAIELLDRALNLVEKENDKRRLQEIHNSYSERIRLLTLTNEEEEDEEDWLLRPDFQKASLRKITSTEFRNGEMITPFILQPSKSTPSPLQLQTSLDGQEFDLDRQVETKHVPSLTLPSLKKEEVIQTYRARTSSLPRIPRSSSMSTVETLDEEQEIHHPIRKKTVDRLSMEDIVERKLSAYEQSNTSPSFGYFLKDQTKDKDDLREHQNLTLILALEKSMRQGAYITKRLYIPKSLWQQTNVKIPHADTKVSVCDTLRSDITRLESWTYLDDLRSSLKLLEHVETSVETLKNSLSKKLRKEGPDRSLDNSSQTSNNSNSSFQSNNNTITETGRKASQSFISWGTRLSKSVERMNAFGLSKGEDSYKQYVEALEKLFYQVHTLENWSSYYREGKRKSSSPQYDTIITKLDNICDIINTVVGGFVIRDITILLAKWLKRGSSWVNE